MPGSHHDRLVKSVFADLALARAWFRGFLPEAVAGRVDLDTLAREHGSFVDAALRERLSDLLFSVELRQSSGSGQSHRRRAFLYLLLEHQSTPDPMMPSRALRAMVRIWDDWLARERSHRALLRLPPILPIVLFHGARAWSAPVDFGDLLFAHPDDLAALDPHLPRLRIALVELGHWTDAELRARASASGLALTLLSLKHARDEDLLDRLLDAADLVAAVVRQPTGLKAIETLLHYWLAAAGDELDPGAIAAVLDRGGVPHAQETIMSLAEKLRREGRQEGLQKGRLEGLQEGRQEGLRKGLQKGRQEGLQEGRQEGRQEGVVLGQLEAMKLAVTKLLETRFGTSGIERLTTELALAGADPLEKLRVWFERALCAEKLDEVFAEGAPPL